MSRKGDRSLGLYRSPNRLSASGANTASRQAQQKPSAVAEGFCTAPRLSFYAAARTGPSSPLLLRRSGHTAGATPQLSIVATRLNPHGIEELFDAIGAIC